MNKTNPLEILITVHLFTQPHLNPTVVGAGTGAHGFAISTVITQGSNTVLRIFETAFCSLKIRVSGFGEILGSCAGLQYQHTKKKKRVIFHL
tara:strand:+ start:464 stop:739 length:276 start_codon:yes stop_codon:yes gene_type:complete